MQEWSEVALDFSVGVVVVAGKAARAVGDQALSLLSPAVAAAGSAAWSLAPESLSDALAQGADYLVETGRSSRESAGEDTATAASAIAVKLAATETVRTIVLSVVDEAMEEILAQAVPATIAAMESPEVIAKTDEIMGDMLLRLMPGVLEKTLPTAMVRVTTRAPVDFVPLLRAAARLDR